MGVDEGRQAGEVDILSGWHGRILGQYGRVPVMHCFRPAAPP